MFLVDWLRWPIHRWTELERRTLADLVTPPMYEASIYEDGEHRPVSLARLSFSQRQGAELDVCVDVDESGGRQQIATRVHMDGVIVQPSMIGPDHDVAAARVALGPYIDTSELGEGVFDRFRYVFPV